jgi:hypothetical protein
MQLAGGRGLEASMSSLVPVAHSEQTVASRPREIVFRLPQVAAMYALGTTLCLALIAAILGPAVAVALFLAEPNLAGVPVQTSLLQQSPMQRGASFNLDAVKAEMQQAEHATHGASD